MKLFEDKELRDGITQRVWDVLFDACSTWAEDNNDIDAMYEVLRGVYLRLQETFPWDDGDEFLTGDEEMAKFVGEPDEEPPTS